jgi:hypothetical protein
VRAIDESFLAIAATGVSAITASGSSVSNFWADLGEAATSIGVDDRSRLYLILTSRNAKALAILLAEAGSSSTNLTPRGGVVAGIEALVSDALTANSWMLIDAAGFAGASGELALSALEHASFAMDTSPDSPQTSATNMVSLWPADMVALTAERFFIAEKLRTNSAALVSGVEYGTGFSP